MNAAPASFARPAARARATTAAALVLAGATIGAAVWPRPTTPPPPERILAERLCRGLIPLQRPDGGYDRYPDEKDLEPELRETIATALATAALARAREVGAQVPGLDVAVVRGLDFLRARQERQKNGTPQKGGGFGSLPAGPQTSPWPTLHAISAALVALVTADRADDAGSIDRAAKAYARAVSYGAQRGWTRGLAAMAADIVVRKGRGATFGAPLSELVRPTAEDSERADCGDFRVAEAIARVVGSGGEAPFAGQVMTACLLDPAFPKWTGDSTDLQSWWMQAWLAARVPGGDEWFRRIVPAIETASAALGRIPAGSYADTVTQTACGILVLVERIEALRR